MANTVGTINIGTTFQQTGAGFPGVSQPTLAIPQTIKAAFSNGTTAGAIDLKYTRTIALAGAPQVLDLKALTDIFGGTVNFARIRSISIVNKSTTDANVLLVGYASTTANAWTALLSNPGQITVAPSGSAGQGALVAIAPNTTGWLVGSSSHLLQLDPGAATFSCDVEICGASA